MGQGAATQEGPDAVAITAAARFITSIFQSGSAKIHLSEIIKDDVYIDTGLGRQANNGGAANMLDIKEFARQKDLYVLPDFFKFKWP
jgi:hypothetical protein